MILDILVFALGFMVAGLLALASLPAVWRRALRLTEERLSRLVPLSPEEIAAERDHLRAAHAVELRRTEQKLEGSEAERAALRIEAARREARIVALDDGAVRAQVRIASLDAEAADLRREAAELWAGHGAEALALDALARLADRRLEEVAALQAERDELRHEIDRNRGSVAGLETRLTGSEVRSADLERELAEARRNATAAAERLAAERDAPATTPAEHHREEVEHLRAELAFMAEQAQSAERRATESARACEALKAERDAEGAPEAARPRDAAALRAAVAALAEDILRATETPRPDRDPGPHSDPTDGVER